MPPISRLNIQVICALLAGLSIPLTVPAFFPETGYASAQSRSASFSDVSTDYWATDYIEQFSRELACARKV
ncbi:MAG: hypothetical protein WA949_18325 [Phormidesmis sp.]